jgi:hypothetical protein
MGRFCPDVRQAGSYCWRRPDRAWEELVLLLNCRPQMGVCGRNLGTCNTNKTRENRSVRRGQVELAYCRHDSRLTAVITERNPSVFFEGLSVTKCHGSRGKSPEIAKQQVNSGENLAPTFHRNLQTLLVKLSLRYIYSK